MRKTKIVCTLGPATDDENVLRQLMLEGMSVARMNFSHGSHEEPEKKTGYGEKTPERTGTPGGSTPGYQGTGDPYWRY